jgi:hypothetical protein
MPEQERTAWIWLVSLLVFPTAYFVGTMGYADLGNSFDLQRLSGLALSLSLMAIAWIGVWIFNRKTAGQWQSAFSDQRDQQIESKATAAAYHVLLAGTIVVGFVMPFSANKWEMVDATFFFVVLAEITHCVLVIHAYRRGIRD